MELGELRKRHNVSPAEKEIFNGGLHNVKWGKNKRNENNEGIYN